ncbi:PQQ-binding-like beta-propeller repeat protein [Euzebya tangerina]|uniref:PQQ-binding-like beta-propeller repeat protein n=1 Tax=Euzebya tangerina TaxID=591198 RepID=UPI000E320648|nr:PQQ-binding-like beta-propeller repeat protein [Euzebya tangerina]
MDDDLFIAREGQLLRRDVTEIPLIQPDPDPVWTTDLFALAGPPSLGSDGRVVVPTPLGARAYDSQSGQMLWAFADTP